MLSKKLRTSIITVPALGIALLAVWMLQGISASAQTAQTPFPGKNIPKFVQPLPLLGGTGFTVLDGTVPLTISMQEFEAKILPLGTFALGAQPLTKVWGYIDGTDQVSGPRETYLGPVIVAQRGKATQVTWVNLLGDTGSSQLTFWKNAIDQTLHWADPLNYEANAGAMQAIMMPGQPPAPPWDEHYAGPIPAVVHLHGGEVPPELDGGPDAWFTSDGDYQGHGYYTKAGAAGNEAIYTYPNTQEAAMIWFHDHLLGGTRLNVYAGLAGAYPLIDPSLPLAPGLTPVGLQGPAGAELLIPLVIQDRMFDTTGQLYFPSGVPFTPNPDHPYWVPEFVGDTIVVNGKAWPYLSVEPRRYRFLFVNGSNARTYEMFLVNPVTKAMGPALWQIGTDGGYLDSPVKIDPNVAGLNNLRLMPGERADVIIDFGGLPLGTQLILRNTGRTPYPKGASPNGSTLGQIIQVRVNKPLSGADVSYDPASGIPVRAGSALVRLANPATGALAAGVVPAKTRALTLNEVMGMPVTIGGVAYPGGPLEILVNNTKWDGVRPDMETRADFTPITLNGNTTYYSEIPNEGETEVWEFINLTADAHPMHTHLTQFQLISRQNFNVKNYTAAYAAAFPGGGMDYMLMQPFLPGVYMAAYGPPLNYNPSVVSGGKYGGNPDITPFLQGKAIPPAANEAGWKDTVMALPGQVTRIAVRYAPTDKAVNAPDLYFPFSPDGGHGYVWHCHIVDHEDNEMMRPLAVNAIAAAARSFVKGVHY
jgi:FtsP/CotA-like multicopper oxidase with cupredoxin domain